MQKHIHVSFKTIDLIAVMAVIALCVACWKGGIIWGWIASVIGVSATAYYINHVRCRPPLFASMVFAIPVIMLLGFLIAFLFGLHHPPSVAPPDWKQPPFSSIEDRLVHSLLFSTIALFFSMLTIVELGILRRFMIVYGFIGPFGISTYNSNSNEVASDPLGASKSGDAS